MQKPTIYMMFAGVSVCAISVLYFFTLVLHIPFILCVALVFVALFFLLRWFNGIKTIEETGTNNIALYILITALVILVNKANDASVKYGYWDAWAIWNLHARYLSDAGQWHNMFLNKEGAHPDYPLNLPGALAFLYRLSGRGYEFLVSYGFQSAIMLMMPVLIFLQTYKRSLVIAAIGLFYFATDDFYVLQNANEYADGLLAFYFLCAIVAIYNYEDDTRMITVCTAILGACCWTKNEGIILSALFMLYYAKVLFTRKHIGYAITGLIIPITALCIFKGLYAPANDIVAAQNSNVINKLTEVKRYHTIWLALKNSVSTYFYWPACTAALCVLLCSIRSKPLPKALLLIFSCLVAYCLVYVVTPQELEWHLNTSIDRLLYQLMPAAMYVLLMFFTKEGVGFKWQGGFSSFRPSPQ